MESLRRATIGGFAQYIARTGVICSNFSFQSPPSRTHKSETFEYRGHVKLSRQLRQHLVRQRDRRVVRNQYRVVVDAEALWIIKKKILHKSCMGCSEQLLPAVDVPR